MLHRLHPDVYGHSTDLYAYCYVERWSVGISFSWASVLFALSTTIKSSKKHIWLAVKVGPDMNYAQNDLNKAIQSKWQRETIIFFYNKHIEWISTRVNINTPCQKYCHIMVTGVRFSRVETFLPFTETFQCVISMVIYNQSFFFLLQHKKS